MSEVGGGGEGGELLHIYNSEASSPPSGGPKGPEGVYCAEIKIVTHWANALVGRKTPF